jgi:hypothetical protein
MIARVGASPGRSPIRVCIPADDQRLGELDPYFVDPTSPESGDVERLTFTRIGVALDSNAHGVARAKCMQSGQLQT